MNMKNLDIKKVETFGWTYPKSDCWWYVLKPAISNGWKSVDVKKAEKNLKANVDVCYKTLFTADFQDLDDSINYTVYFDNQKKLFDLKLTNSSNDGEVLPEQKKAFFKSDVFKKTAARAYEILERSKKLIIELIDDHIQAGELLAVDEIKLEAIMHLLEDQMLLKNFRLRKYAK